MSQTAMQIMYEELMCYEYTIPLELIVRCKELIELEKEQIVDAATWGYLAETGKQYYKEKYNK